MPIKALFVLAANQDDKTNLLRLWNFVAELDDINLMMELNNKYQPVIFQALTTVDKQAMSSMKPFENLAEAIECIVSDQAMAETLK